jgi:hypothetical protein
MRRSLQDPTNTAVDHAGPRSAGHGQIRSPREDQQGQHAVIEALRVIGRLAVSITVRRPVNQAVCLCIAVLGVNARFCRDEGRRWINSILLSLAAARQVIRTRRLPVSGGGTATAGRSGPELAARRSARLRAWRQAGRSGTWTACGVSHPPGSGRRRDRGPARSTSPRTHTPVLVASYSGPAHCREKGCTIEATNHPPGRSTAVTVDKVPARSSMSISASSQVQPSKGRLSHQAG